jgi:hypothetical protein
MAAFLPCQSYYQSLGNLLEEPWDSIWNHPLALHLRERRYVPAKCQRLRSVGRMWWRLPIDIVNNVTFFATQRHIRREQTRKRSGSNTLQTKSWQLQTPLLKNMRSGKWDMNACMFIPGFPSLLQSNRSCGLRPLIMV